MAGLFVTFEGTEGSGKTTLIEGVVKFLEEKKIPFFKTREPGGTETSEKIRKIIMENEMHPKTEALLYAASRSEHVETKIKPMIQKNTFVLCDRFYDSSLVYQGLARGLGIDYIYELNKKYALSNIEPDITFLLLIKPELGLNRIIKNARVVNRFDKEKLEFHKMVYEGYLMLSKKFPNRFIVIDASKTKEEVLKEVLDKLSERLKNV